jgi:hypothetical protein
MALVMQPGGHTPHPIKGAARVRLIQQAHEVQIFDALVHRLVVQAGSIHPKQLAFMPSHTDPFVMRLDPLPPLFKWAIQLLF